MFCAVLKIEESITMRHRISVDGPELHLLPNRHFRGTPIYEPLWPVADAIEESRRILELEDNWDGEGSPGYLESTWNRAVEFLMTNALALWEDHHIAVDAPAVHNGPNGSIDIYWKTPGGSLLFNVPPENVGDVSFYGSNKEGGEIKGSLRLDRDNRWLVCWQTENR